MPRPAGWAEARPVPTAGRPPAPVPAQDAGAPPGHTRRVRLATFNILHARSPADGRVDLDRFAAAVRLLDADVLGLQEVDRDQARSHGADLTSIAAQAMGAPAHRFVATLHGAPGLWVAGTGAHQPRGAAYGIALLSRHPVREWRVLTLPVLRRRAPVRFPGRRWPELVRDEPRAAIAAVVEVPGGPLTVVCTHLTFIPRWNGMQLRRLVRQVQDLPRPLVLLGDLNLDGGQPAQLTRMVPLATAPTYPTGRPVRQLDHILGEGAVAPAGPAEAVDLGLSDHRALVVDVRVGPTAARPGGRAAGRGSSRAGAAVAAVAGRRDAARERQGATAAPSVTPDPGGYARSVRRFRRRRAAR